MSERHERLTLFEWFLFFITLGWIIDMFTFYDTSDNLVELETSYIDWDEAYDVEISNDYEDYEWEEIE